MYATLQRYQSGSWTNLANSYNKGPGGITIIATAYYNCNHTSTYAYRTEGLGYAVVGGVGFTALDYAYANHTCPG